MNCSFCGVALCASDVMFLRSFRFGSKSLPQPAFGQADKLAAQAFFGGGAAARVTASRTIEAATQSRFMPIPNCNSGHRLADATGYSGSACHSDPGQGFWQGVISA